MRRMTWIISLAALGLLVAGCESFENLTFKESNAIWYYKRADIEGMYAKVNEGWTEGQVVALMGKPSRMVEHEMFYIYDDPDRPVRLRFVLDEKDVVIEKYYETKDELAKRAAEATAKPPAPKGEKPEAYPGAPLERFTAPPGETVF